MDERTVYKCKGCSRQTTAIYCCQPCAMAHSGPGAPWDIEGEHSVGCNERHAARQKAAHKAG